MPPKLAPDIGIPALCAAPMTPLTIAAVDADRASKKPGFATSSNVFKPAATATGLPDSVPA